MNLRYNNGHTIRLKFLDNPLLTVIMCLAVHRTRTEVTLLLTELVGTIGTKRRTYGLHRDAVVGGLLAEATGSE